MMTTNEVRQKFLDFFAAKGHKIVASDSLVPKDDPTVLFTTAGMQQFKRQFLGQIDDYTTAVSSQKCLRTDDLEEVGKTPYHHTFFEMLGNFSFGGYFKEEAIQWAWEFLTQVLGLHSDDLWVSVYKDDTEAEEIWLSLVKLPEERLVKLGDKSNFWPANAKKNGPNGPCGPCSEIFYDYGVNPDCTNTNCNPDCDCGRFSEIWNLVFTQFNRKDGGVLEPLPSKNIDTGMGLERLAAVVQGKKSNFETDVFEPIFKEMDNLGIKVSKTEKFVIADHIRAIVFGISDGVVPSNEGRGYIMKKLIIDITDMILRNNNTALGIHKLVPAVVTSMGTPYPELKSKIKNLQQMIHKIEESYREVRKIRVPELKQKLKKEKASSQNLGEIFFIYRDTYGLPLTTIRATAIEGGINQNTLQEALSIFDQKMEQQKERSRASSKMTGDVFADANLDLNVPKTEFLGYTAQSGKGKILKLFIDNQEVPTVQKGDQIKIILDQTPFYAESGGQIGDTGTIIQKSSCIQVDDTQKIADIFIHSGIVTEGSFQVEDQVETQIDAERRFAIMRNHTATHLLQSVLREVLGTHVQQQGSLVAEDRLRFDFTHPKGISKEELKTIENLVNNHILACDKVQKESLSKDEAQKSGALAFFAEKYGETVRVVSIGGYSKEFCGGTHLEMTGQVGLFKIISESAVAQGIRRIEAITGIQALKNIRELEQELEKTAQTLNAPIQEVASRVKKQTKRLKEVERELEELNFEKIKNSLKSILDKADAVQNTKVVRHYFPELEAGHLRKISDLIKQKEKSAIIILGSRHVDTAHLLIVVTEDLVKKGIKANELITDVAAVMNGSGGGRPQMAQAGSKEINKIEQAIEQAKALIEEKIPA